MAVPAPAVRCAVRIQWSLDQPMCSRWNRSRFLSAGIRVHQTHTNMGALRAAALAQLIYGGKGW
jgi:hypothetical protein